MPVSTEAKGRTLTGSFQSEYAVFVEGDVVVLNSGGPPMTIIDIQDSTGEVVVAFADGTIEILGLPSASVRKVTTN